MVKATDASDREVSLHLPIAGNGVSPSTVEPQPQPLITDDGDSVLSWRLAFSPHLLRDAECPDSAYGEFSPYAGPPPRARLGVAIFPTISTHRSLPMDAERFDTLVRFLTAAPSRRTMLGFAIGGALAPLLSPADIGAKKGKKKGRGKKKRRNLSPPPPPPPPSGCPPGTEACGGTCVNTSTDPFNCGGCGKRCQIQMCDPSTGTCLR